MSTKSSADATTLPLSYWALNYRHAAFYRDGTRFEDYAPAIYLGITAQIENPGLVFDDVVPELEARYQQICSGSTLSWSQAACAAEAAWTRARMISGAARAAFESELARRRAA
ncbi:hypothetical protein [Lysobacter antibioticus]|jgi:hypothetical protein|uniref:hypothetical protein n=1 Tax=Lysobacter antibioticus TaxID=84531 RepID=UPI000B29D15F|nr:hypothetical protein [Lysobacter antibioticus]